MDKKQYKYDEKMYDKYKPEHVGKQNSLPKGCLTGAMGSKKR